MRRILLLAALVLIPYAAADAATDYYLKLGGVEGETTSAPAPATRTVEPLRAETAGTPDEPGSAAVTGTVTTAPQEASVDAFLKIDGVEGEAKKGNVEMQWKVEEGEKAAEAPGVTDVAPDAQPLTPDFSILLGGGSDEDEEAQEGRAAAAEILLQGMQEAGAPAEQVSLNYEKIKTKLRQDLKLFGLIPVRASVEVEVDAEERVTVRFPWWAFLASGKQADLGERVFATLSDVLKTRHDAVKNAIGNVR